MRLKEFAASMRRHRLLVGVGLVAGIGAALGLPPLLAGPVVVAHRIVQRDFVESVVASGHVEAPHRINVGTVLVGTVQRIPVVEGQHVDARQSLIELDASEWAAAAAQADANVAQARAKLRQVSEVESPVADQALRQAEATLVDARRQHQRDAALLKQGFIGPAAMDESDKALALAQSQWHAAIAQQRAARPQGADDAVAVTNLEQAISAAAAAHAHLGYARINAPAAGTLIARNVEVGDVVQPGTPLMVLSPDGPGQLVVDIDEKNFHLLALGQNARATADAYADRVFDARVAYINPGIDIQRGTVEVKLDVPRMPEFLRQDMTISVDIQVASRAHAVLIPLDAVADADGAHPWTLRVDGARARRRELRLGVRGAGYAEVLAGLAPGDLVLPVSAGLVDGQRVRAHAEAAR